MNDHPGPGAAGGRPIRPGIAANNTRGTATSVNWNTTALARRTTLAPISISFSRSVVKRRVRTDRDSACRRRKSAGLEAGANNRSRAWVSLKRRHDSRVHLIAFFPSLTHCSAVPRLS